MYYTYPAIVHEGENGGYWAEFVDFNAFTQGDNLNELLYNAEEAMLCHIEDELQNGLPLPIPSDVRKVAMPFNAFATLVHAGASVSSRDYSVTNATVVAN